MFVYIIYLNSIFQIAYEISSNNQSSKKWIVAHNLQEATKCAEQLGFSSFTIRQDDDVLGKFFQLILKIRLLP